MATPLQPQAQPQGATAGQRLEGQLLQIIQALTVLTDPNASDAQKALAYSHLGTSGLATLAPKAYAALNPTVLNIPAWHGLGGGSVGALDAGFNLAGLGLNLADIAKAEGLSTKQKVGQGTRAGVDTALSLTVPYYALARFVQGIGQKLERSGSPQVRGAGRTLDYAAEPAGAKAFWDVATGMRSPAAAFKAQGGVKGALLDTMGPVGLVLRGIGWPQGVTSQGGKFREGIGRVFDQLKLPINTNFQDRSAYNYGPNAYAQLPQELRDTTGRFANELAGAIGEQRPEYVNQLSNILLNNFGPGGMTDAYAQFQKWLAENAPAQPAAPAGADALAAAIQDYMSKPKSFSAYVASR